MLVDWLKKKVPSNYLKIFSVIGKKLNNVTLRLLGDGKFLKEMKEMVKNKNLKKVKFLGQLNYEKDIPDIYVVLIILS